MAHDPIHPDDMRALERSEIDAGRTTGAALMARAGAEAVAAILDRWPHMGRPGPDGPRRAQILCGPGNNGGDGYVVARLLRARGWRVEVLGMGEADAMPPDARAARADWGGPLRGPCAALEGHPDLIVDALFGIGLSRPIEGPDLWEELWSFNDARDADAMAHAGHPGPLVPPRTVSLDIASGLDAVTGRPLGLPPPHGASWAEPMLTVAFHAPKPGHLTPEGRAAGGALRVLDIGLPGFGPQRG
ncbi:MAG: NAD(P)H-hydrate epimerase [Paracoccaceae bacterium]